MLKRVALAALLLAGCTSSTPQSFSFTKGLDANGTPLAVVHAVGREQMATACRRPDAPDALACMYQNFTVTWNDRMLAQFYMVALRVDGIARAAYELVAHEACHYVAGAYDIVPDPCHAEDGGYIDWRP